jgi:hypothetical protein
MAYLQSISFPLRRLFDCPNRDLFFDSTLRWNILTTHWNFFLYLQVKQFVFVFDFLIFVALGGSANYN